MARYRVNLRTLFSRRRRVADWLDPGKGPWWLRPLLQLRQRRILRAYKAPIKPPQAKKPLHRFPSWLIQQGAYWISNVLAQRKAKAVRKRSWRGNARNPKLHRRVWDLSGDQGPYWISNVLARLKARRRPQYRWRGNARKPALHRRIWDLTGDQGPYWVSNVLARLKAIRPRRRTWQGNARRPRLHRFPSWLVQQGAYWTRPRRKLTGNQRDTSWRGPRKFKKNAAWNTAAVVTPPSWISNVLTRLKAARPRRRIWSGNQRRPRLHRFPSWLVQQGAYWLSNALQRRKAANVRKQPWRGPRKFRKSAGWLAAPPVTPSSWISNVLARLKLRRQAHRLWRGNARRPQLHRFPAWLVQQGAYWVSNSKTRRKAATLRKHPWRGPRRFHKVGAILALPPPAGPTTWYPSRTLAQRKIAHGRALQRLLRPRSRFHYRALGVYPSPPPPVPVKPTGGTTGKGPVNNVPSTIGVPGGAPNNQLATAMYLTQLVSGLNNWTAQAANAINYSLIQGPPATSTSRGIKGQIAFDGNYLYVCTATNTWARIPLGAVW